MSSLRLCIVLKVWLPNTPYCRPCLTLPYVGYACQLSATHDLRGEQVLNNRSIVPHRSRKVSGAAQLPVGIYCVSTTWTCTQGRTSHMTSQNPSVHGLDFTSNQAQDVISDQLEELYLTH
ncbi:hypothetical protein EMCRGX_G024204 [Ephydatia muelleri]